jgi:hypothetical protein
MLKLFQLAATLPLRACRLEVRGVVARPRSVARRVEDDVVKQPGAIEAVALGGCGSGLKTRRRPGTGPRHRPGRGGCRAMRPLGRVEPWRSHDQARLRLVSSRTCSSGAAVAASSRRSTRATRTSSTAPISSTTVRRPHADRPRVQRPVLTAARTGHLFEAARPQPAVPPSGNGGSRLQPVSKTSPRIGPSRGLAGRRNRSEPLFGSAQPNCRGWVGVLRRCPGLEDRHPEGR